MYDFVSLRHKAHQALQCDEKAVDILSDEELPRLWNATNMQSAYEVQRLNIVMFAYSTGFRPETLKRLCIGWFQKKVDGEGRTILTVNVGTMKNHPGRLSSCDAALLRQDIISRTNQRYSPISLQFHH